MLNRDDELMKYIPGFTLSNKFSFMTVILMNILYKHLINLDDHEWLLVYFKISGKNKSN